MKEQRIIYRVHAVQRMFEWSISEEDVQTVLAKGEVIKLYPDDKPYPSRLMLGFSKNRPLHVVAAYNVESDDTIIITVYEPDTNRWDVAFRLRR